ncbi:SycD/LcrH family type III secretion system chaperone [Citrobacter braakii]|uniref:SycD/LcrH family type III secretion system chaperone n=1 Tax=Citrobacter braakii TaxID=57706 RepID=UPI0014295604|nr:SycD/LcrH family type III secretion system chaperone [Citrobacter braakii]ECX2002007.1 CesD/SycD/LcrH family type III secretion system chaperone [Salmonella enterica subsp. enterica serovar Newport]MBJ9048905.1 SycD/LcrH family type III secretion system chaperone [Citrobacter braakii]
MDPTSLEQMLWHDPVLKKTLELSPDEVYARGYAAWQQRDYDRALVDFSWMVMTQPWSWRAHVALAGVYMMQKEFVLAINYYGYALMLNPCNPESVYQMAVCLKEIGELSEARVALQTALTMSYEDPSYSTVRANAEQMLSQLLV